MCKSEEEIYYSLGTNGIFIMQDVVLSPQNYNSPVKFIEKQLIFSLSPDFSKLIDTYWQKITIETDKDYWGFVIRDKIEKQQHLKFEQYKDFHDDRIEYIDSPLLSFIISLSEQELTETRTYETITTVLGDIGGFMGFIFSFFNIILNVLTDTLYNKSLINHLFSFDINNKLILVKKKILNYANTSKFYQLKI